jgi:hypothetical protein
VRGSTERHKRMPKPMGYVTVVPSICRHAVSDKRVKAMGQAECCGAMIGRYTVTTGNIVREPIS